MILKHFGNRDRLSQVKGLLLYLTPFLLACPNSWAEPEATTSPPVAPPQNEAGPVENVEVLGYRDGYYQRNLIRTENAFFNLMNTLVDDDDFKVSCEMRAIKAFSRLKARTCEARFVSRIKSETTQRNFRQVSPGSMEGGVPGNSMPTPSTYEVQSRINKRQEEQLEMMVKLIKENPSLFKAYQELEEAKRLVEESKAK